MCAEVPARPVAGSWQAMVEADDERLPVTVTAPAAPRGAVVLVRGTMGARLGTRSRRVAGALVGAGYAVVLPVLRPAPVPVGSVPGPAPAVPVPSRGAEVLGAERLADRVVAVTEAVRDDPRTAGLPVGYFATSTGATAALVAAARLEGAVSALVARAGRPDLARSRLTAVTAATLLVVGGADPLGVAANGDVEPLLRCPRSLEIIPGVTHLFAEPGAMDELVGLAVDWFDRYLGRG